MKNAKCGMKDLFRTNKKMRGDKPPRQEVGKARQQNHGHSSWFSSPRGRLTNPVWSAYMQPTKLIYSAPVGSQDSPTANPSFWRHTENRQNDKLSAATRRRNTPYAEPS